MQTAAVVLPVYNEANTVVDVVEAVKCVHSGPIVVVEDGSVDGTAGVLAGIKGIHVFAHKCNRGYGRSLIDGFVHALSMGVEAVVTMDCDGQHEPACIPGFLAALECCDIASGSRYLSESPIVGRAPVERQDVNRQITECINAATGWSLTDTFCGFKAYRSSALRSLRLTESGYAMPLELWAEAYHAGLHIDEFPVARIYFSGDRSFGQELDDPEHRLRYYTRVWERAFTRGRNG